MRIFFTPKMRKLIVGTLVVFITVPLFAGNNDRSGSAAAPQLLILNWARTGSLAGSNLANVKGMEAMSYNVAGMAFTEKTEIGFGSILYMGNSGITVNSLGMAFRLGESSSSIGLNVMQMSYGKIEITTTELPEGGAGVFAPNFLCIGLSYAKEFSNSIYGGITVKLISESISNVSASNMAFDAGINYVTGPKDNIKFGISLRNVGGKMQFRGDGLDVQGAIAGSGTNVVTLQSRSAGYEMPAQMGLGITYDVHLTDQSILDLNFTFLANSFSKDQFSFGVGYGFKDLFHLRAGYLYESDINDSDQRNTVYTGPAAGVTVNVPLGKGGTKLGLDYAYRVTNPFSGFHQFALRLNF